MSEKLSYASGATAGNRNSSLAVIGGAMGIAASSIGLAIFLAGCFGFDAAFKLAFIPLILAVPGLILSIIGGLGKFAKNVPDPYVLAAIVVNLFGLLGGFMEVVAWQGWQIFPK